MNDPQVDRLHYSIRHPEGRDYTAARPQEGKHTSFTVRMDSGQATVTMIDHFATAEDARAIVEPFLRELSSALLDWSGFEFVFQRADIIDRSPSPRYLDAQAEFHGIGGLSAEAEVDPSSLVQRVITRLEKRLPTPPRHLHHYTSLDAARKILEQDDVRLSHAEYSNDQMEMAQAKKVIGEFLAKASGFSAQVRRQYEAIAPSLDAYIFCTSSADEQLANPHPQDRLTRWRAYGQDGRGVCLSFVKKKIDYLASYTPGLRINPAIYEREVQEDFVKEILAEGETLANSNPPLAVSKTVEALVFATPLMKAEGFSEEQEWRLIFMPPAADLRLKLKFHPRRDFLAPFLTLKYIWNELRPQLTKIITIDPPLNVLEPTGEPLLPVAEVMVGPSGNQPLNERAMMKLLAQTPWQLEPKRSCIPYRSIQ